MSKLYSDVLTLDRIPKKTSFDGGRVVSIIILPLTATILERIKMVVSFRLVAIALLILAAETGR